MKGQREKAFPKPFKYVTMTIIGAGGIGLIWVFGWERLRYYNNNNNTSFHDIKLFGIYSCFKMWKLSLSSFLFIW
jgi:hypothetical protein